MRPIYQTILDGQNGDCMAACIASLLELDLDAMPNPHTASWWDDWQAWLKQRGLYLVEATGGDWTPPGYAILVGTSPRGDWQHAVVALDGEIVHDPHPGGGGVVTRTAYDLIVPYDPGDGAGEQLRSEVLAARRLALVAQSLVAWYFDRNPDAEPVDADDLMYPLRERLAAYETARKEGQDAKQP